MRNQRKKLNKLIRKVNKLKNNDIEPNYKTIEAYYKIVYKSNTNVPDLKDLTFLWIHISGNLDAWSKNGISGDRSNFRWPNQPLIRPGVDLKDKDPNVIANEIVFSLPKLHQLWTPDWFSYPQSAINRYDPQAWNQRFFDIMNKFTNNGSYSNIQQNEIFEVSNTGGPAIYSGKYEGYRTFFFYEATGSGIQMKVPRVLYALNKIHAVYVGKCYECNNGILTNISQDKLKKSFKMMYQDLQGKFQNKTLLEQMEDALTLKSGYFGLDDISIVDKFLWTPLVDDYPLPSELTLAGSDETFKKRLYAVLMYNIGALPHSDFPQPNIANKDCVATNAFKGLLSLGNTGVSNIAQHPYEYYVQVATNLTVQNNILDEFVNLTMETTNCQACVNVVQWNALGGWTTEIPSYYGKDNTAVPSLVARNRGELKKEWWTGAGGLLGINSYKKSNPEFDIPEKYLNV